MLNTPFALDKLRLHYMYTSQDDFWTCTTWTWHFLDVQVLDVQNWDIQVLTLFFQRLVLVTQPTWIVYLNYTYYIIVLKDAYGC